MCAKAIVNAGINEVVYGEKYRDVSGLEILMSAGVIVRGQHCNKVGID
jgi:deoxycytidylate deaminase